MPVRGRKPTPTHLKLVAGNPGKRALPTAEAKPKPGIPTAPAVLSAEARREWKRISVELASSGLLTVIDRAALAAYCAAYGTWVQAQRAINEMAKADMLTAGLMITTTNGNAIQNPLVGTANKAAADMVRYATEFGMTPSARTRINANPDKDTKEDPAARYLG